MATITVTNQSALDAWLKENAFDEPDDFLFNLVITDDETKLESKSIAEIHGHFLKLAIAYIEDKDFFDDYDDFIVSSVTQFDTNDGDKLTYRVDISLQKEN